MTPKMMARLHAISFAGTRPWSDTELTALIAAKGAVLVSAEAGFALGRVAAGEAEILTIAVDPAMRRQGHGAALLAELEQKAAADGAEMIFLEVAADNAAAQALYAGAGYRQIGLRRNYYKRAGTAPVDAIVLKKSLMLK